MFSKPYLEKKYYQFRDLGPALFILILLFVQIHTQLPYNAYSLIPLTAGLALRFWAGGYLGSLANGRELYRGKNITQGPYFLLKHPIYKGNFLIAAAFTSALIDPFIFVKKEAVLLSLQANWVFLIQIGNLLLYGLQLRILEKIEEKYLNRLTEIKEPEQRQKLEIQNQTSSSEGQNREPKQSFTWSRAWKGQYFHILKILFIYLVYISIPLLIK